VNFDLQLFSVSLPDNPFKSDATAGEYYLLYVNAGTVTNPEWKRIGGQRSSTLNRKATSVDVSNRTSGRWRMKKVGLREWSIDLDGLILLNDGGLEILDQAFMDGQQAHLKFQYPDLTYRLGWAIITDFNIENPYNDAATVKGTLEGSGPLSDLMVDTSNLVTISKNPDSKQIFNTDHYIT